MVKIFKAILLNLLWMPFAEAYIFDSDSQDVKVLRRTTSAPNPGVTTHIRQNGIYLRYENHAGKIAISCIKVSAPRQSSREIRYTRAEYNNALNRAMAKVQGMSMSEPLSSRPQTRRHPGGSFMM